MGILFRFGGENVGAFNSRLTLYSGVPLDNTYEHTYTEQNKLKYSAYVSPTQPLYYIRPDKNMVRIQHDGNMKVGNFPLYECNYLTFSNNAYEGIDFYCFVTEVRYINDDTAEIDFEVDVMMTWVAKGLVTFEDCFVERETTNSDLIGEHILEEPVDVGSYFYSYQGSTNMSFHIIVGVKATYKSSDQKWEAGSSNMHTYNGIKVCDGVSRYVFSATTGENINGASATNDFNNIQDLLASLKDDSEDGQANFLAFIYVTPINSANISVLRGQEFADNSGSYVPNNKKLLTFPYMCCSVNNYEGQMTDFPYELVTSGDTINFQTDVSSYDGSVSLKATNYLPDGRNYMLTKTKFPVMSSSANEYSTYQAQLKSQMVGDLTSNVIMPAATGAMFGSAAGGVGGIAGAAIGGGIGLISYVAKAFSGGEQAKLNVVSVGTNAGFLPLANNTAQFGFYEKRIRTEYAKAIDSFFTKFGYKVNRLKTPSKYTSGDVSQGGRTLSWHYIKTIGCALDGQAPASAVSKIQSIMDNGITFWNKPEIGRYTFPSS